MNLRNGLKQKFKNIIMPHFIEKIEVTEKNIGDPVTYIPNHAFGDASHKDCERGHISSFSDVTLWVRFKSATGESCDPQNLVWG